MKYTNPPVYEVVLGIQFKSEVLTLERVFDFYQEIKQEYPKITENPSLPKIIEKPDGRKDQVFVDGSRYHFVNETGDRLIQLQKNWFLYNWRKNSSEVSYPKFSDVFECFSKNFQTLNNKEAFDDQIEQLEITFVDHILMSDFGKNDLELDKVLNVYNIGNPANLIDSTIKYYKEDLTSNIYIKTQSARRHSDKERILFVETTCRGSLSGISKDEWFTKAHNHLVELFEQITTAKAKTIWGGH